MGLRRAGKRALYELRRRSGWLERRCPLRAWEHYDAQADGPRLLANLERFPLRLPREYRFEPPTAELEEIRSGRLRLFGNEPVETGWPPRWLEEPGTRRPWEVKHWSRYESLGDRDVKVTWEPGRFAFTWPLLRAHAADRGCGAAELFWQAADDFRERNPPNRGPHWMCGQEASVRALALVCGLAALRDDAATTPERVARLAALLEATGDRIEGNLAYALMQKNNHGIVESLGLYLAGLVLAGRPPAERWRRRGRESLRTEIARQVGEGGAYVQHSLSYHRFALEAIVWSEALALAYEPVDFDAVPYVNAIDGMTSFLLACTDPETGGIPAYGSTDGSRMMRLDSCSAEDVRPTVAWVDGVSAGRRPFVAGPWHEPVTWMTGADRVDDPERVWRTDPRVHGASHPGGGYETPRARRSWALLRCTEYTDRPGQADMTHLDLWWKGHNLVCDPGTYAYNAPPPWDNGLASTRVHNAVTVDGLDQMERGPGFTWLDWTRGRRLRHLWREADRILPLHFEHDGFEARLGVTVRRAVVVVEEADLWIVVDDLLGEGEHEASSQWLFPGATLTSPVDAAGVLLQTPPGPCGFAAADVPAGGDPVPVVPEVHCGDPGDVLGWFSSRYMHREAAPGLVVRSRGPLPLRRVTVVAPGGGVPRISRDGDAVVVDSGVRVRIGPGLDPCTVEDGGD